MRGSTPASVRQASDGRPRRLWTAGLAVTLAAASLTVAGAAAPSWASTPRATVPGTARAGEAPAAPGEARLLPTASGHTRISVPRPRARAGAAAPGTSAPSPGNLSGAAAVSSQDVWAVGAYQSGGTYLPVAEHWDGSSWTQVPVPAPANTSKSYLNAVAAVSADDVWAVGAEVSSSSGGQLTLIEHWDGSSWSVVPSPSLGSDLNMLDSVTAVSAGNVWAVGNGYVNGIIVTEIQHWNGAGWMIVSSPNVAGVNANQLNQITVVSARNIWAVGYWAELNIQYSTLAEHWNGTTWSIVKTPKIAVDNYDLQGVSAVSARDVLAVGSTWNNTTQRFQALAERWNGTRWRRVAVGSPPLPTFLFVPTALSASDAWCDGWFETPSGGEMPMTEHWNGTSWQPVSAPAPTSTYSNLIGIAAISADDVWAVGSYQDSGPWYPLYDHWNGQNWTMAS
jgi:hypothetical protein